MVTVAAAACTRNAPPPEEPSRNPPAPQPEPVPPTHPPPMPIGNPPPPRPACPPRDQIQVGAACQTGLSCYMPTGGCQPSGFQCADGVWREVVVTCNPPPPPREKAR